MLAPEGDPLRTHTAEGADGMLTHVRSAFLAMSISVPIVNGNSGMETWQGVLLWEYRRHRGDRQTLIYAVS